MQSVQKAARYAHEHASEIDTEAKAEAVADKVPETHLEKLKKLSEDQLRRFEQRGASATGLQPAQSMAQLKGFAIGLVVVGVTVTVGLKIMSSVKSNINDTTAQTGAQDAIDGMTELSGFLPIIGLVVAAAVVIGLVSRGFGSGGGARGRA